MMTIIMTRKQFRAKSTILRYIMVFAFQQSIISAIVEKTQSFTKNKHIYGTFAILLTSTQIQREM